ncbi:MAG: dihydropteroate synthase [Actinobacteria bacterium]|nr:dihydropteroate synthase [Actinomycetota bacterium]
MGILNVTPDSFSDGGLHFAAQAAIAHGLAMHAQGADIVDVGGESTRPGAERISAAEEEARILPVVIALVEAGIPVSIDTMRASTATSAVHAGACIVNDVSGGLADDEMYRAVASLAVPYVVMHWRGPSATMGELAVYGDVVGDVVAELRARIANAVNDGIAPDAIIVDPGLGFAKDADHNWALLHHLADLQALGHPVLIGASRKRFLGALLAESNGGHKGEPRAALDRDAATDAVSALSAAAGAWGVRVHDVANSRDAVLVGRAWARGSE